MIYDGRGFPISGDGKIIGQGVRFERIRRITGYLVGDVSRFNNGKRAEEHDRVKHASMEPLRTSQHAA